MNLVGIGQRELGVLKSSNTRHGPCTDPLSVARTADQHIAQAISVDIAGPIQFESGPIDGLLPSKRKSASAKDTVFSEPGSCPAPERSRVVGADQNVRESVAGASPAPDSEMPA